MKIQKVFMDNMQSYTDCFKKVFEIQGRYVNDHCFIIHNNEMHLFYIDGETGKGCYDMGNEIIIGHAVSKDLISWEKKQPALVYDQSLYFEERGIFAPYVYKKESRFYMFYSSHNIKKAQFICLAFSDNLNTWQRYERNPLFKPSSDWIFWDDSVPCSCRDPHIFYDEDKKEYILYWVADIKENNKLSCIASSISNNLFSWQETGPVLIREHSFYESITCKTESPCLIKKDNLYYLFYRHGNGTKYCISDSYTNFTHSDSYYLGPSHASEIFMFKNQWYISSCSRKIADLEHKTDRSKGLFLARLSWNGLHPEIYSL
jgi:sucrose-6-phosphate hydrolase SacC (GH32 family)